MTRRASRALTIVVCAALGGLVVAGAAVAGLVVAPDPANDHPARTPAAAATWAIEYRDPDGSAVRKDIRTDEAECRQLGDVITMTASSEEYVDAFRAMGNPHRLTAVTLRFGDLVFLATERPPMDPDTLRVDGLHGQIHEWTDGGPGPGASPDATLRGAIGCAGASP